MLMLMRVYDMYGGDIVYTNKDMTWVVLILSQISFLRGKTCTGSMIKDDWVLTAAHCVEEWGVQLAPWKLRVRLYYSANYIRDFPVLDVYINPGYVPKVKDDIALIRTFNHLPVTPVPVSDHHFYPTGKCTIAGYGQRGQKNEVIFLSKMKVVLLPEELCTEVSPLFSVFCLPLSGGKGPCMGDSGSPLICDGVVIGVLSRGLFNGPATCGEEVFGVILYEEVVQKKQWFLEVFNKSYNIYAHSASPAFFLSWPVLIILIIFLYF